MQNDTKDKQWRTRYLVSQSRIRNVRIRFASNMGSAWRNSTRSAINAFNAISNTKLYLREVSGSYDIYVRYGNTPSAYAEFPYSDGSPGRRITIGYNTYSGGTYGRNLTRHEIGHCIGFRHDHAPREGIASWQRVPGTPYSDTYSIMSYNSNAYITYWDKRSIQILYPR